MGNGRGKKVNKKMKTETKEGGRRRTEKYNDAVSLLFWRRL